MEITVPFKSLRYKQGGAQIWGVNVRRIVQRLNEHSYLNPAPAAYGRTAIMKLSSAATLVGVEAPLRSTNLELKPYGISCSRRISTLLRSSITSSVTEASI